MVPLASFHPIRMKVFLIDEKNSIGGVCIRDLMVNVIMNLFMDV
jgi:hypothetical protein